jgi:hypothetical protein
MLSTGQQMDAELWPQFTCVNWKNIAEQQFHLAVLRTGWGLSPKLGFEGWTGISQMKAVG